MFWNLELLFDLFWPFDLYPNSFSSFFGHFSNTAKSLLEKPLDGSFTIFSVIVPLGFSGCNKTILEGPPLMGDPCIQGKMHKCENYILKKQKCTPYGLQNQLNILLKYPYCTKLCPNWWNVITNINFQQ